MCVVPVLSAPLLHDGQKLHAPCLTSYLISEQLVQCWLLMDRDRKDIPYPGELAILRESNLALPHSRVAKKNFRGSTFLLGSMR